MAQRAHGRDIQHKRCVSRLDSAPVSLVLLIHHRNFADVFKTPGKLRGKTPRTARKKDALEQRQPLTDIFAPNAQVNPTPAKSTAFYEKVTQFQIAEDGENVTSQTRPLSRSKSPQRLGKPGNTDSGYHGMCRE